MAAPRLTRFELELMERLWELEEASIRQLQESIDEEKRPAYTTVQTLVGRLEAKGAVRRTRKIGNAYMYAAAINRKSGTQRLIDDLLGLFGGSARPLVSHLIESGRLSLEDVKALEASLGKSEKKDRR
ncbi:MAG TPA: BlaI/MecI/CopY family transcriptional regulator [Thermoanaerobaculia bacterium]|nr:BlaI/MecI/CopY family transcriptional regulator [Thermoanaerobaculia bacterium]